MSLIPDTEEHRLLRDHAYTVLPYLLHFGDAISMGHSVESRLPFLDHRLVEFVSGLAFRHKINGRNTKSILRRALQDDLPKATLTRSRKVGFETPVKNWLRPIVQSELAPLFNSVQVQTRDLFDQKALGNLLDNFQATGGNASLVFRCAAIELWFRKFIDGEGFA
jgi:asparagine synthase (glutamine-hydrolysing)